MRKIITITALTIFSFSAFSQKIKVSQSNERIGGGSHSALTVMIYQVKSSEVRKEWKNLIKGYNAVKVSSKKEIFADDCRISSISDNTIDVYAKADEKNDAVKFVVGFDLGGVYLSSSSSGYKTAERMVYDFAVKLTKMGVENELKDTEKELHYLWVQYIDFPTRHKNEANKRPLYRLLYRVLTNHFA